MDHREQIRKLKELGGMPAVSEAGARLLELERIDGSYEAGLMQAIRSDDNLNRLLLKLVNWRREREGDACFEAIEDALGAIRDRVLRSAALGFSLINSNRSGLCEKFNYDEFWSLALARGIAAFFLSRELRSSDPEIAFVCALLYRVGSLALAGSYPYEYSLLVADRDVSTYSDLRDLERQRFGVDHVQLSQTLFEELDFPEEFLESFRGLCGDAEGEGRRRSDLAGLIEAAERIASLCLLDEESREEGWLDLVDMRYELELEQDALSSLGDTMIRHWWDWGEALQIPTQAVSPFSSLEPSGSSLESRAGELALAAAGPRPEPVRDSAAVLAARGRSLRILAVDDDPMSVKLIQKQLQSGGHEVVCATNGKDALSRALEFRPHAIVADWVMPEMDGLDLCRALRRIDAGRKIFFFLLTGREEEDHVVEAFEAGVDDFLTKPSSPKLLLARVRAAQRVIGLQEQVELDHRLLKQQLSKMNTLARQLREAAVTDALTELPNRRYAVKRLNEEWSTSERRGRALSVIMIDIDHFKRINDDYGHDVGDAALCAVARLLDRTTRRGEIACRFGGEEFLVICSDGGLEEATQCGERIRWAVEREVFETEGRELPLTVSVGVAHRTEAVRSIEVLLKHADEAVYRAKAQGRNRLCSWSRVDSGSESSAPAEKG